MILAHVRPLPTLFSQGILDQCCLTAKHQLPSCSNTSCAALCLAVGRGGMQMPLTSIPIFLTPGLPCPTPCMLQLQPCCGSGTLSELLRKGLGSLDRSENMLPLARLPACWSRGIYTHAAVGRHLWNAFANAYLLCGKKHLSKERGSVVENK